MPLHDRNMPGCVYPPLLWPSGLKKEACSSCCQTYILPPTPTIPPPSDLLFLFSSQTGDSWLTFTAFLVTDP